MGNRHFAAWCVGAILSAVSLGAVLAQVPPTYTSPSGATLPAEPAALMGLDAITGAKCFVGSSATCELPGLGGGAGGDSTAANQGTQITAEQAIQATLGAVTASPTANTIGDRLKTLNTTLGSPLQAGGVVRPFATATSSWQASVSLTDNTNTALHASCGGGLKNYVTSLDFSSVLATTAVSVTLNDGSTGIWATNIGAGAGGRAYDWQTPKVGTANTAVNAQLSGSPTGAVTVNASGYCGA